MSLTNKPGGQPPISEQEAMESNVRRALGMPAFSNQAQPRGQGVRQAEPAGPGHQKRRFVQDGEVPVVVLRGRGETKPRTLDVNVPINPTPNAPVAGANDLTLRMEREARETAERALVEANHQLKDLRTRIGHASLAADEAREAARLALAEKLAVDAALAAEQEARRSAEAEIVSLRDQIDRQIADGALAAPERPRLGRRPKVVAGEVPGVVKRGPGRPPKPKPVAEPQPVKWWIKKKPAR